MGAPKFFMLNFFACFFCTWFWVGVLWYRFSPAPEVSPRCRSSIAPERPRKRSQSVSWNSPREYGWDAPSPIIQGIWGFQSISFSWSGSGEGLSELVMEFLAVLRVLHSERGCWSMWFTLFAISRREPTMPSAILPFSRASSAVCSTLRSLGYVFYLLGVRSI